MLFFLLKVIRCDRRICSFGQGCPGRAVQRHYHDYGDVYKRQAEDHQQDEDQVSKRKDLADSRSEPQCVQVQETGRDVYKRQEMS